jgi:hypothetical protein
MVGRDGLCERQSLVEGGAVSDGNRDLDARSNAELVANVIDVMIGGALGDRQGCRAFATSRRPRYAVRSAMCRCVFGGDRFRRDPRASSKPPRIARASHLAPLRPRAVEEAGISRRRSLDGNGPTLCSEGGHCPETGGERKLVFVSIHQHSVTIALLSLCLAATGPVAAQSQHDSGSGMNQTEAAVSGLHDFDFLVGKWLAHHRRLKKRLANDHEWVEFDGTLANQPLMGGYSNVDDTVLDVPGAPYRGLALRSFDPKTAQWSIWWLDGRTPSEPLDPPMVGGFHNGVGIFFGDDTVRGKQVRARFIWSNITPTSCHWEQSASPDGGKTWETNWVQDITRVR